MINPYRMMGRIESAALLIMSKHGLSCSQIPSVFKFFLIALSMKVEGKDKDLCVRMANAYDECENATRGLSTCDKEEEKAKGNSEAVYIFGKYESTYGNYILADTDFLAEKAADALAMKKRQKITRNIIVSVAAVLVACIVIYNLPYYRELRAYHKVEQTYSLGHSNLTVAEVANYAAKFPEGKHLDDVMIMPVRSYQADGDVLNTFVAIDDYLHSCPDGKYAAECSEIYNDIWSDEIAAYESKATGKATTEGEDFIVEMLRYMQQHNVRTVSVVAYPTLKLKEYSEYSENIRKALEFITELNSKKESETTIKGTKYNFPGIGKTPHLPQDMVTIKDKITEAKAKSWAGYIVEALNKGFDDVLTPGFIKFVLVEESERQNDNERPIVNVNYAVTTEDSHGIPDIWRYSQKDGISVVDAKFILGIGLSFNADFVLPESDVHFVIKGHGNPGEEEINGTPNGAYDIMCMRSMAQFAARISDEFGIATTEKQIDNGDDNQ